MTLEEAARRLAAVVGELPHGATAVTLPIHEWRDFMNALETPETPAPVEEPPPPVETPADDGDDEDEGETTVKTAVRRGRPRR